MEKGNILKEAIADAKAVREVALENAKAALEEAFTPKLQNMLSARLSEDLGEEMYYDEDEKNSMDEEIDLEEILNELELEEGDVSEETELEEVGGLNMEKPYYTADKMHDVTYTEKNIYEEADDEKDDKKSKKMKKESSEEFNLDALLNEINNLDEQTPEGTAGPRPTMPMKQVGNTLKKTVSTKSRKVPRKTIKRGIPKANMQRSRMKKMPNPSMAPMMESTNGCSSLKVKLQSTEKALEVKTQELNEVNLLNSKLLYVNRIFKANQLDDSQKLRVVETLDKADSAKEAKLIYETIKDTFTVANAKKVSNKKRTKTIKENFRGMASKAAGVAPKKAIISESDNMVNRFQKLANIKINE